MKYITVLIIAFLAIITFNSCKKDTSTICENLLEGGIATQSSLIGEWEFKDFAYTANGKKIKNKDGIQKGYISVTDTGTIRFSYTNEIYYSYSVGNANSISLTHEFSTKIYPPQEETDVFNAFSNSKCFVVNGNKLLIHYTEKEKKNILILNKK